MTHDSGSETIEGVLGSDRNVQITAGGIRSSGLRSADGDLGGVAARRVDRDGSAVTTMGAIAQVNGEERFDQRSPVISQSLGDAVIVAWTDGSDRARDPGFGVRARRLDAELRPLGAELTLPSETFDDQSSPSLSHSGGVTTVSFVDTSSGIPAVRARRFEGALPLDASSFEWSAGWAGEPITSRFGTVTWSVWQDRTTDERGDVAFLHVEDGMTPAGVPSVRGVPAMIDEHPTLAAHGPDRATVGWETDAAPDGVRVEAIGWTFPPESGDLMAHLAGGRERDLRMLATARGLWLTWTDASIPGATSSVVAYLLPWD